MRPEDFSPGNRRGGHARENGRHSGFNEAGGFLPRKHSEIDVVRAIGAGRLQ